MPPPAQNTCVVQFWLKVSQQKRNTNELYRITWIRKEKKKKHRERIEETTTRLNSKNSQRPTYVYDVARNFFILSGLQKAPKKYCRTELNMFSGISTPPSHADSLLNKQTHFNEILSKRNPSSVCILQHTNDRKLSKQLLVYFGMRDKTYLATF